MKKLLIIARACAVGVLALGGIIGENATFGLRAEPTPLKEKLPEGGETLVRCQLAPNSKKPVKIGRTSVEYRDGEYSYKLWIPQGYDTEPARRWPCVFIASPGGKANMGPMADHLKNSGYIVVSLQESKNDCPLYASNFVAAHDDVVARLRVAESFKFVTGMSGGSRVSSIVMHLRPGFRGLFQQAAGFGTTMDKKMFKHSFCIVTSIGCKDDLCFKEWKHIPSSVPRGVAYFPIITNERHSWSQPATAEKAFLLMETQTLLDSPPTAESRAIAKAWLARHALVIERMEGLGGKIHFAERTLKAATKQNFSREPTILALNTKLQQWKKDPVASKEIAAEAAFGRLFLKELTPFATNKKIARAFSDFARHHSGTDVAARAKMFAETWEKQK